jgi:cytochrome c oxidase cbb3-type subunit III
MAKNLSSILSALLVLGLGVACELPGKPDGSHRYQRPENVLDPDALYKKNCAGCHGADGQLGPAAPMNNPLYLAWAPDEEIKKAISHGVQGTAMPAFHVNSGGTMTEDQVNLLVLHLSRKWGGDGKNKHGALPSYRPKEAPPPPPVVEPTDGGDLTTADGGAATPPPPPAPTGLLAGDVKRGQAAYQVYCASCHGKNGRGGKNGDILQDSYLALVSDQGLRTTIVAGRPDLGMPNHQGYVKNRTMKDQEIHDVIAWITSHRKEFPGQPYSEETP